MVAYFVLATSLTSAPAEQVWAVFDVDYTLIRRDSAEELHETLHALGLETDAELAVVHQLEDDYGRGTIDAHASATHMANIMGRIDPTQRDALIDTFVEDVMWPALCPRAHAQLLWHRDQGHTLAFASATTAWVIEPFAKRLGVPHVVSGNRQGDPSLGVFKAHQMVEMATRCEVSLPEGYAYSDSRNDIAFLSLFGHPCAVNPDATLRAHALQQGWAIEDWWDRQPLPKVLPSQ